MEYFGINVTDLSILDFPNTFLVAAVAAFTYPVV